MEDTKEETWGKVTIVAKTADDSEREKSNTLEAWICLEPVQVEEIVAVLDIEEYHRGTTELGIVELELFHHDSHFDIHFVRHQTTLAVLQNMDNNVKYQCPPTRRHQEALQLRKVAANDLRDREERSVDIVVGMDWERQEDFQVRDSNRESQKFLVG